MYKLGEQFEFNVDKAVANEDEDLDDSEIDFVIKVSKFLNIEDEKVAELNQLVLDEMSLSERCYQALELG